MKIIFGKKFFDFKKMRRNPIQLFNILSYKISSVKSEKMFGNWQKL